MKFAPLLMDNISHLIDNPFVFVRETNEDCVGDDAGVE